MMVYASTWEQASQYMKSVERHKISRPAMVGSAMEPIASGDFFEISDIGK